MERVLNEVEAHRPRTAGGAASDASPWSSAALRRPSRAPVPAMSYEQARCVVARVVGVVGQISHFSLTRVLLAGGGTGRAAGRG
jgi:hypothetical protein